MTRRRPIPAVTVTLECGCRVACRAKPMPGARMSCTNGQGHGYNLLWVKAEGNGLPSYNKRFHPGAED